MLTIGSLCWLCQQPLYLSRQGICTYCQATLPVLPEPCLCCGLPTSHSRRPCERCLVEPPLWQRLIAVSDYVPPLSTLVQRFKYQRCEPLGLILARQLLRVWLQAYREGSVHKPDIILPVPLHRYRQWQRGFNQAEWLARPLARWLQRPCLTYKLHRVRKTASQQTLTAYQRQHNLQGAFHYQGDLTGLQVAVIDDVITTGSTLNEISRILLDHGASSIQVLAICRTL